jgi:hypothetical protein
MLKPLTEQQKKNIVRNVLSACRNIEKLNGTGYNFLYLAQGFIAHYNINGFKAYYSEPGSLQADIERNARVNQWHNFRPGERDVDYYHSKRDTYNRILAGFCVDQYRKQYEEA